MPWPETHLLLAAMGAAFLAGLARGFSGFGAALIFVPLGSAILGPRVAAPLLLVVDLVMASPMIPRAWRVAARGEVAVMALGALAGVPAGAWLLLQLDAEALRWGMCAMVLAMVALLASGWRYQGAPWPPATLAVGAVSGLFSGAAQMGGPPLVAYWMGGTNDAARVRANLVLTGAVGGVLSAVAYLSGGLLGLELLLLAAALGPLYGLGLWLGGRLFGLASQRMFRRICFGLILLAAVVGLPLWDR
ncbi:MAG TPA: sulfite exporter TauE/SafE family protein [Roseococcus sp.]|jgi:hypothetical protein|nr:sulfite exporter TauE/SafE family protein [Roseococcus sp.]